MVLAAFWANAIHLHFGIKLLVVEFKIIKFFNRGNPVGRVGTARIFRFGFFKFRH